MPVVPIDLYTHPKPRLRVTSPLELVTSTSHQDPSTSPVPFARGFKEMQVSSFLPACLPVFHSSYGSSQWQSSPASVFFHVMHSALQGVHVLVGNSALHRFPPQQRASWGLCSIRTATLGQSPPKLRCQDSWLLREDKSDVYNEVWWCIHVLLRQGVNFGPLKSW